MPGMYHTSTLPHHKPSSNCKSAPPPSTSQGLAGGSTVTGTASTQPRPTSPLDRYSALLHDRMVVLPSNSNSSRFVVGSMQPLTRAHTGALASTVAKSPIKTCWLSTGGLPVSLPNRTRPVFGAARSMHPSLSSTKVVMATVLGTSGAPPRLAQIATLPESSRWDVPP